MSDEPQSITVIDTYLESPPDAVLDGLDVSDEGVTSNTGTQDVSLVLSPPTTNKSEVW